MQELGSQNLLLKIPNYLKACPAIFFPEHRVTHAWSPPWVPFRGCWRSVAIVAPNLILVEVDGKCQFVVGTNIVGHKWERGQLLGQKGRGKPHRLV